MPDKKKITVAYGDGIGPEIMKATLNILDAAGAQIDPQVIEIGEKVFKQGNPAGIEPSSWDSLRETQVFLKAPITTPQGGGFKSLNVTTRTTLGLYANVRPCRSYSPYVATRHNALDMVIIRENEEDLYAGIEHQQTEEVVQSLKLISRPGCEKIIRYAFEYAKAYNRKKVTCFTKDNIMKLADGLFHRVFNEIGEEYPEIEKEHMIIDIGSAILADKPETLDVVVTLNLYGDIISDIAAQIAGSVGLGGSANVGEICAMFEAIHGSAPPIAGKDIANPSGLINAAIMMLVHIGQPDIATNINNAWLKTMEDGIHTADIYRPGSSTEIVGTQGFAKAVINNLGKLPKQLKPAEFMPVKGSKLHQTTPSDPNLKKELIGVDVFLDWKEGKRDPQVLGKKLEEVSGDKLKLDMITNRGVKVYPEGKPETFATDHWRCRFVSSESEDSLVSHAQILDLLRRVHDEAKFDFIKTENLYTFNGKRAFSSARGD
ncbi:NADP-dependent isocitrate dehydrogenase [Catalinimonas sp. 4WD22]|uniref:NADP-dependent isocitrate dehydrogenase n=1 Tax=Catalinimonas locisalis TaxID=3133978 RepID=UPI0031017222